MKKDRGRGNDGEAQSLEPPFPVNGYSAVPQGGIIPVACREIRRIVSRPIYLVMLIGLPVISFGMLLSIFFQGSPRDLPIAVYDADHSALSRQLIRMVDATQSIQIAGSVQSMEAGKTQIQSGKVYALIVIPEEFEKWVLKGLRSKVILYYNNQFLLPGSLINRDAAMAVSTLSAGLNLRYRESSGEQLAEALSHIEPISIESHVLFNPYLNYLYFLLTTLQPTLFQIFVMTLTIYAAGIELKQGTAESWLKCAGGRIGAALIGKMLPYTISFVLMAIAMQFVQFYVLGIPLHGHAFFLFVSTCMFILAYQSMGLLVVAITANLRFSISVAAFYSGTAFAFSGVTFPTLSMPLIGQFWGYALPLTSYLKIVVDQTMRGAPIQASIPFFGALVLFVVLPPIVFLPRMKKVMQQPQYWGRA
jgi:ABC-2 type transport system permease protein